MRESTQLTLTIVELTDPRIPDPEIIRRFWSKVDTSGECWLWTKALTNDGYGAWSYRAEGRQIMMRAHRFAFLVTHGSLTDGLELHHECGTKNCVRPAHLVELKRHEHLAITPGSVGHTNSSKTHCVRDHELSGDNLLPCGLRRGIRKCRQCSQMQSAEWRAANPEKMRAAIASYKERHADEVRAKDRAYKARQRQMARQQTDEGLPFADNLGCPQ